MKKIKLSLFDGEGAAAETVASAADNNTTVEGGEKTQADDAQPAPDKAARFKELLKGEFKDEYEKLRRSDSAKSSRKIAQLQRENESYKEIAAVLGDRYGVDRADKAAIMQALNADRTYLRDEAMKNGVTEEYLEEMNRLRASRFEMDRIKSKDNAEREFARKLGEWRRQAEEVKETYPDFDFDTEMRDKRFFDLLKRGFTPEEAYINLHHHSILQESMAYAAQQVRNKTIADVQANGARPVEGASSSGASIATKSLNADAQTASGREKLLQRAMRGEKIVL